MQRNPKGLLTIAIATCVEKIAIKKANANCAGLMYEQKRPELPFLSLL